MKWRNVRLVFLRELRDQLRDRRTLFMITILPVLLYPMLGLGIVEMMLTFSAQKRTVVILNADGLPTEPAFLSGSGIDRRWLEGDEAAADALHVITDRQTHEESDERIVTGSGRLTREELLAGAQKLAAKIRLRQSLGTDTPGDPDSSSSVRETTHDLSYDFDRSGIHVLVIVPEGYQDRMRDLSDGLSGTARESGGEAGQASDSDQSSVMVVRNSADDRSTVAFGRIRAALTHWEDAIRDQLFVSSGLPAELQKPAALTWVEVARGEQVAANVWSKLFPAMLVIMSLTGAFYPAIDLGAGEKERGTMETLLISPAGRLELVLGKFFTILCFSIMSAVLNLASMGFTGRQMASSFTRNMTDVVSLEFPGSSALMWLLALLVPLAALFSALCLALATFARSTKEGQYYLTPLLMVVLGLTMFCLSPEVEITPLYSVIPVVNVALLLKGLLLSTSSVSGLTVYIVPVLVSSFGYSMLALWWAIDLYNSETVLFRESEKFDLRGWFRQMARAKDAVPAPPEAVFCFIIIMLLQYVMMNAFASGYNPAADDATAARTMLRQLVISQLTLIACPAVFMGLLLTTSPRATFRLRRPTLRAMLTALALAVLLHPVSVELVSFLVEHRFLPEAPEAVRQHMAVLSRAGLPWWVFVLVFALTPAICEELAFRGFILSGFARGGRLVPAVIASSMMFGAMHMIPQQVFNATLLGLVLGIIAIYSRSLFPAIAFHLCSNSIAVLHSAAGAGIEAAEQLPAPLQYLLSVDSDGALRYSLLTVGLCLIPAVLLLRGMIVAVAQEQRDRRRGRLETFRQPSARQSAAGA